MSRAQGSCRGRRNPQKQPPSALGAVGKAAQALVGWTLPSPSCLGDEVLPASQLFHPPRQAANRSSHSPLASGTSRSGAARIPSASRPEPPRTRPAQSKHRRGQAQQEPSPAARRQRGPAPAGSPRKALSRPHSPKGGTQGRPGPYHGVQEADAACQLGARLAELPEQRAPDGLPLAQAVVVPLCKRGQTGSGRARGPCQPQNPRRGDPRMRGCHD